VTTTVAELTLSEMILLAAAQLEEQGQTPFSAEDLIVASWKQYPRAFGLKGYWEQHPDSNRVLASIMGERGLARKGWLMKVGQKMYSLSKEGQRICRRLSDLETTADEDEEADDPPTLPREQEKLLLTLLDSSARDKIKHNRSHDLSFGDACRFWGLTENLAPEAIDSRLQLVERTLGQAGKLVAKGSLRIGHRDISRADVELLRDTSDNLQERFARHLTLLRARGGR
jgi:hypothetical protein